MRSRALALTVLCVGQLMIILDGTIVNIALPSIQRDLGFSAANLAWVVNAYLVPFAGLLLLAGRLGDLSGRKRVFVAGLVVFTAASIACGFAADPATLLAARFVQGIGGAMTTAVTLGMVATLYPDSRERARAIGVYSFVQAAGGSLGLVAGGVLTQAASWHWIFFINVPIGIVTILLATRLLAPDHAAASSAATTSAAAMKRNAAREHNHETTPAGGTDIIGAIAVTAGLMLGIYAIVETTTYGWLSAHTLTSGFGAIALLAGFFARQATATHPLMPLRLLRSRIVSGALSTQALMIAGIFGFQLMCVLYLQNVLGIDEIHTGLAILPVAVAIGAMSLGVTPRLIGRFGARNVLLTGLILMAAGLLALGRSPVDGHYATDVLPALAALGIGFGLAMPSVATLAMSVSTPEDAGVASGMFNTMQQVGSAVGLAVVSTVAAARTHSDSGVSAADALTAGYHLAFRVGAMFVGAAFVVAALALRREVTPVAEKARLASGPVTHEPVDDRHSAEDRGARRR